METTDVEKIEWLTATVNALMESQERLAGEIRELRSLLSQAKHHLSFAPMSFTNMEEILQIRDKIDAILK